MAYDKIIPIRTRLDDCLRYVQDGEKPRSPVRWTTLKITAKPLWTTK